jgi:hypothetical protein
MKKILTTLCLLSTTTFVQAGWVLNQPESDFNFSSIKKTNIYEVHTFKKYQGSISDTGDAVLEIDLSSVSTGINIRDERIGTLLFNTAKYPVAQYQLRIDPKQLDNLKVGERLQIDTQGSLQLLEVKKPQAATLNIYKLTDKRISVNTAKPVVLSAANFGLDIGIEALREIANLPVISHTVPINFSLVFDLQ